MRNASYIENHELWQAYQAVCLSGAGKADLQTLAHYDIDPLADDAEDLIREAIDGQAIDFQIDLRRDAA